MVDKMHIAWKKILFSRRRVHCSVYVHNKIGSGKWTRYGTKRIVAATGWVELSGDWVVVYDGRGKQAKEVKRIKYYGAAFSHIELTPQIAK